MPHAQTGSVPWPFDFYLCFARCGFPYWGGTMPDDLAAQQDVLTIVSMLSRMPHAHGHAHVSCLLLALSSCLDHLSITRFGREAVQLKGKMKQIKHTQAEAEAKHKQPHAVMWCRIKRYHMWCAIKSCHMSCRVLSSASYGCTCIGSWSKQDM